MQALDDYINQVKTLPLAPRVLAGLFELLEDENVASERVVELITFDPALTAKVLQRCNSAASGLAQPVHDVEEAVLRVGFNEIFRLVLAVVSARALGAPQRGYGLGPGELWQHSAVTAVAAQVIARALGDNENIAFTAALLHDVGKLVLSTFLETAYAAVVKEIEEAGHSFVEAEKAVLGVEHSEVGGRVLALWNFPENLSRAVWFHHDPPQARPYERLAAYANLGDLLSHFLGYGHGHDAFAVRAGRESLDILQVSPSQIEPLLLETHAALKATRWFNLASL